MCIQTDDELAFSRFNRAVYRCRDNPGGVVDDADVEFRVILLEFGDLLSCTIRRHAVCDDDFHLVQGKRLRNNAIQHQPDGASFIVTWDDYRNFACVHG